MGDLVKGNKCTFARLTFIFGENLTSQPTESISDLDSSVQDKFGSLRAKI